MSVHHVRTVIGGFGIRVVPVAPFGAHLIDDRTLEVVGDAGIAQVIVEEDGHRVEVVTGEPGSALDVVEGPKLARWRLETSTMSFDFPMGWALSSVPEDHPLAFDLQGPGGELAYLQPAPESIDVEDTLAPDQTRIDGGADHLEVAYEHEGERWRQRHLVLRLDSVGTHLLTVQAPESLMDGAREVLDALAKSAAPTW